MSRIRFQALLPACILLIFTPLAAALNSAKKLEPTYRHWIEVEVPYIISTAERKEFLSLTTDEQRDSFIKAFWQERNPDPGSDTNTYKEEHYRRLAYVNENFGNPAYESGWRTPMGRIYIVLGAPKQRATYHEKANLRPMEIWFYEAQSPALPPYFYILFYRHSMSEDWRVYSPTMDGPVALVTTGESKNDNQMALRFIRNSAGDEVAKTACTLIPGEHADLDKFEPTMESDSLLETINGLADNPLTREALEANRLRERVTLSTLTGDDGMLAYDMIRDGKGRETLNYLYRESLPDARLIGQKADGSSYYDLELRTSVLTPDGKSVYEEDDPLTGTLTAPQAEVAKRKRFAAEGRAPLAPGTYILEATLTNNVDHVAERRRMNVTVPEVKGDKLAISTLLEYAAPAAVPDTHGRLPFSFSGFRFTPRAAQTAEVRQGDRLPLVFQLWLGANSAAPQAEKIHIHYVFGAVTAAHDATAEEREDVDSSNCDAAGNLLTGHTLDTSSLSPGIYRVVVTATRDSDHRSAYAIMSLKVIPTRDFVDVWTAYAPSDPEGEALDDLKRAISAEAQGADTAARAFYTSAMSMSSTDMRPVEKLAALLSRQGDADELAKLSQQPILMHSAASPKTLLAIGDALRSHGNTKELVRLFEAQIKLQPPSAPLYLTLADACEASGDSARAHDLRTLASTIK
ncbi:MAG TPA: GWxTD domain-containing protein [Terracidiphilus sp.]|nr:GWxTD domain-containing protein [Terracidiphilus sp.]